MKHNHEKMDIKSALQRLGIKDVNKGASTGAKWLETNGTVLESYSPGDGKLIASVKQGTWDDYQIIMDKAQEAFKSWRMVPAPHRGEIVRQIGLELRKHKEDLGMLVSYEMGKVYQEASAKCRK